ncbi:ectoine hydroxylase [Flexivirga meconopsidis]|uniref:ectoine hydroxylase n=1 Tax=Flexivirga meconopsidis TaxID=2977121 RepID=UPI0022400A14|nr:ectoine hydroxylase [Flexivirga meconopsidis]
MTTAPTTTDHYPTRLDDQPRVLPRTGPVVHGSADDGPLDTVTLQRFDDTGYLMIDQLVTGDELAAMRRELTRMSSDDAVRADERTVIEAKSQEVRSIFDVHLTSPVFGAIARDRRVVDRARQLLGSDVYIHQSRVNAKPAFEGKDFFWHSDFETWHAEDGMPGPRAVSISISLTDNHSFNGPLMIMPGSHRSYVSCVGGTPEDNYKSSLVMQGAGTPDRQTLTALADEHGIDVLEGSAGGAIMFDSNCMHASNGNVTPFPRSNVFIVYNSVENTCVEPYAAPAPRPSFLGARDFTPLH